VKPSVLASPCSTRFPTLRANALAGAWFEVRANLQAPPNYGKDEVQDFGELLVRAQTGH
jgi:hypothetical protein